MMNQLKLVKLFTLQLYLETLEFNLNVGFQIFALVGKIELFLGINVGCVPLPPGKVLLSEHLEERTQLREQLGQWLGSSPLGARNPQEPGPSI